MDLDVEGRRAFVSGSTAGIGWATARRLAAEGAAVVVNGRTDDRVEQAVERVEEAVAGAEVRGVAADLGTVEGAVTVIESVPEVDLLVNNVGIFEPAPFTEIDDDSWMRHFQVNVMSGVRLTRHYLPGMRRRGFGRVVFVSSESAVQPPAEMIQYGVTKTAQLGLARGVAETTRGVPGVTVNSVLPGPTASEGMVDFLARQAQQEGIGLEQMKKRFFEDARPSSLLQRFIDPDEVAAMIAYVCSGAASATNGASLRVDGGVVPTAF